jgi:thiol:disulfide interchange protein DsbC
MKHLIAGLLLSTVPFLTVAAVDDAKLKTAFAEVGLNVSSIADSSVPGLLQIMTDRGLFFATKDGSHLIEGQIYNLNKKVLVNEEILKTVRKAGVANMAGSVIEFKAPNEKYAIHVFTDISCGYCRKLHAELPSYLDAGITVRYLAFPRGGLESDTFNSLQSVWCAKDKQKAMDEAKGGAEIAPAKCDSPIAKQFELGHSFGISGTPAIILPDGGLIPGYQSAAQLQTVLAGLPKS